MKKKVTNLVFLFMVGGLFSALQIFALTGDANNNGVVDITDALLVAQYSVGLPVTIDQPAADANCDNTVNIVDALLIAQFYVGIGTLCNSQPTPTPAADPNNPPITPAWALRPWIWEDNGNTRTSIEGHVNNYLSRNIPVGAVIIDSPWATKYNTYVWDTTRYPDAGTMIQNFHAKGIKVLCWITGYVNTDSPDYNDIKSKGYCINGGQDFTWWKGTGVHIDHTNPAAYAWLNGKMDTQLNQGIDGWKCDEGPDYLGKSSDLIRCSIGNIPLSNFQNYYYAQFYDHSLTKNPNAIITARGYAGTPAGTGMKAPIAKNPCAWQGDFGGDFAGISSQAEMVYETANSGYACPGVEVGGYMGANPSKNSLIRYAQFGALCPYMENGGSNGGLTTHCPWYWDTQTVDIYRYFAVLHNELVPYNFSNIVDCHLNKGSAMKDANRTRKDHKLGNDIFVSILTSDVTSKSVLMPSGNRWIDYWNEDTVFAGGTTTNYNVPLDRFPIFIRTGAIIPMEVQNDVTGHGDSNSSGKTTLAIYPNGASTMLFHRPTGDGIAYEDIRINVNESAGTIQVAGASSVAYKIRVKSFTAPTSVTGAGAWSYDSAKKCIVIDNTGSNFIITIGGLAGYTGR